MTYEQILTETRGRVGIITLNRPNRLNAMTATMHPCRTTSIMTSTRSRISAYVLSKGSNRTAVARRNKSAQIGTEKQD